MSEVVIQKTELGKSCRLSAAEPSRALDRIAEYAELAWPRSCAAEVLRSLEGPPRRDQARAGDYPEGQKVLARGRKLAQGARLFNFGRVAVAS